MPGGPAPRRLLNAVLARGCAEFCALDERAARGRLESGLAALASAGIVPRGFTPPGWLASPAPWRPCAGWASNTRRVISPCTTCAPGGGTACRRSPTGPAGPGSGPGPV
ncbi:hypothetical protein GCM10020000_71960 [Streptomyces olivoverticillatus]